MANVLSTVRYCIFGPPQCFRLLHPRCATFAMFGSAIGSAPSSKFIGAIAGANGLQTLDFIAASRVVRVVWADR
jgi:hypothetical protein